MWMLLIGCQGGNGLDEPGQAPGTTTSTTVSSTTATTVPTTARSWSPLAALLEPLQENAVVVLSDEIVVVGGFDDGAGTVARVEAYDPVTDRWRSLPDLPVALHHANVAVVDDSLFVVGSLGPAFLQVPDVWRLDSGEDWVSGAAMPDARAVGSAVTGVLDGKIHVVGGVSNNRSVAWHSVYDPVEDSWEALPDAPTARNHAAGGVVAVTLQGHPPGDVLVVVGGRVFGLSDVLTTVERFDLDSGWTTGAAMPTGRGGLAAAALDGVLHALGGEGNGAAVTGVFEQHESYDVALDSWTSHPPMATPRHGTGAAGFDGAVYVPGGAQVQAFGADDTNEVWR